MKPTMHIRPSYDYAKPTTLVAIISDAMESADFNADPMTITNQQVNTIVSAAFDALVANAGQDEALEMLVNAGIGPVELDVFFR